MAGLLAPDQSLAATEILGGPSRLQNLRTELGTNPGNSCFTCSHTTREETHERESADSHIYTLSFVNTQNLQFMGQTERTKGEVLLLKVLPRMDGVVAK